MHSRGGRGGLSASGPGGGGGAVGLWPGGGGGVYLAEKREGEEPYIIERVYNCPRYLPMRL